MAEPSDPWGLIRTETFLRALRKYLKKHPDRSEAVRQVLTALTVDPWQQRLRLHPLGGQMEGLHAVRVTHGDRIILVLAIREHQIVLLDIGLHDAVYR